LRCVVLAFAAILDPRMKLEALRFCFEKIDSKIGKDQGKIMQTFC